MHKFSMPEEIIARVVARVGRTHPFEKLEGWVTCHWHCGIVPAAAVVAVGDYSSSVVRVADRNYGCSVSSLG